MKSLFLSIFISLILPCFAQAKSEAEELFEKWGEPFIEESLNIIHQNMVIAVFISDYYRACLTNDDGYFDKEKVIYPDHPSIEEQRKSLIYSKELCNVHLSHLRDDIERRYPLMRAYMAIAMNNSPGYVSVQSFYAQNDPPEFSEDERRLAEQIFNRNMSVNRMLSESDRLTSDIFRGDSQVVCAISKYLEEVEESKIRECFHTRYLELFFGNEKKRNQGLPFLAFVTSENPSDDELVEGIDRIRRNGFELLKDFERKYAATMDKEGNSSFGERAFSYNIAVVLDTFGFWLPRVRTDFDGYLKLEEAGATKDEVNKLLGYLSHIVENHEGTTFRNDCDKAIKVAFYRPDSGRSSYTPFPLNTCLGQ